MKLKDAATAHLVGLTHRNVDALAGCIHREEWTLAQHIAQELQHLAALTLDTPTREAIGTTLYIRLERHGLPVAVLDLLENAGDPA